MDIGRYKGRVEEETQQTHAVFLFKVDFRSCGSESERTKLIRADRWAHQASARVSHGTP